jgi:hypothetical protein
MQSFWGVDMQIFKKKEKQEMPIFKGRKTMPTIRCTDPGFKYVPAVHTNLAATFERARRDMGVAV